MKKFCKKKKKIVFCVRTMWIKKNYNEWIISMNWICYLFCVCVVCHFAFFFFFWVSGGRRGAKAVFLFRRFFFLSINTQKVKKKMPCARALTQVFFNFNSKLTNLQEFALFFLFSNPQLAQESIEKKEKHYPISCGRLYQATNLYGAVNPANWLSNQQTARSAIPNLAWTVSCRNIFQRSFPHVSLTPTASVSSTPVREYGLYSFDRTQLRNNLNRHFSGEWGFFFTVFFFKTNFFLSLNRKSTIFLIN